MGKKEDTRKIIIEKSREKFFSKGLVKSTVGDIAEEAGITRRTMYRYFESKEELAYEIAIDIIEKLNRYNQESIQEIKGKGVDRLGEFLLKFVHYFRDRMEEIRYLTEFDYFFSKNPSEEPGADTVDRFKGIILNGDGIIEEIIQEGMKDGSIRDDIDLHLSAATVSNVLWSFGQRIALMEKNIIEETGIPGEEIIINQVKIYIDYLRRG